MTDFEVSEYVPVVRYERKVHLHTDDPVEAEVYVHEHTGHNGQILHVKGRHPTHTPREGICSECGVDVQMGSFRAVMPCGWSDKRPYAMVMYEWKVAHDKIPETVRG